MKLQDIAKHKQLNEFAGAEAMASVVASLFAAIPLMITIPVIGAVAIDKLKKLKQQISQDDYDMDVLPSQLKNIAGSVQDPKISRQLDVISNTFNDAVKEKDPKRKQQLAAKLTSLTKELKSGS
jgi:hypothetical protein